MCHSTSVKMEGGLGSWLSILPFGTQELNPVIRFNGRNFYPLNHLGLHYWHFKARVGADHN